MRDIGVPAELQDSLYVAFAAIVVRENRKIRKAVLELKQGLLDSVEREEEEYGSAISAYAGEETCEHIIQEIVKPRVYFNTKEQQARQRAVEEVIEKLLGGDPESDS